MNGDGPELIEPRETPRQKGLPDSGNGAFDFD